MANRGLEREEYWRGIVEDWTESDLSQRRFCEATRISYPTFCYWRRRLREEGEDESTTPFIPVEVKPPRRGTGLSYYEVHLEGHAWIRVPFDFESDSLVRLIGLLRGEGC